MVRLTCMTDWGAVIGAIPARPTRRGFLWSIPGEYSVPERLAGRSLEDIASAYGRPGWWHAEIVTGGIIACWPGRGMAMRFSASGTCTQVLRRVRGEMALSWRIRALGDVRGMLVAQVARWLGLPNSRSWGHNYTLLQWQAPGYHIALKFGPDGRCTGITHQHMRRPLRP